MNNFYPIKAKDIRGKYNLNIDPDQFWGKSEAEVALQAEKDIANGFFLKIMPWYTRLLLFFLPTKTWIAADWGDEYGSVIKFKKFRGKIYVVSCEEYEIV